MKKSTLLITCLFASLTGFAQITITNSDMPSAGDTFRVSNGLITPTIDPVPTGASFLWDFSSLQMVTQDVDSFVSVSSTGTIFSLIFSNLPFNPNRANLAAKGPDIPSVPQLSLSDVFYFYYNSSASYQVSGYGATINGVQAPIPFNNKDIVYNFPLNFGNIDSSDSDFQLSLPGLGFYGHNQRRVNEVDGWGTLITPFGSFNTIRVKSMINSNDSLYLDSLGTGFGFSLPPTTEYKWLGAQSGIPLLQITTTNTFGTDIVTSIVYRDSVRTTTGLADLTGQDGSFEVYPNPAGNRVNVDLNVINQENITISLISADGKHVNKLWSGTMNQGFNSLNFDLDLYSLSDGIYLVEVKQGSKVNYKSLLISN